ncbi:SH3 domain-containing protein [Draconibacterium sp.]|nr:SH3 domain-containing protein [Draconibacterium sp.]
MTRTILAVLIAVFTTTPAFAEAKYPGDFVVSADTLNVRLAAKTTGKVAGRLHQSEKIEVLEVKDGWARISAYYGAEIEGQAQNVARWVFATHLSPALPAAEKVEEGATIVEAMMSSDDLTGYQNIAAADQPVQRIDANSPIVAAIKASEDLAKYMGTFVSVSGKLIDAGECQLSDFEDIGGWWRSVDHQPRPIYYTYCGGASNNHRVFVNVNTGRVFR